MNKKPRILNVATIKQRKYDTLDMGEYYNKLLGEIESSCRIFIYGSSGSGKSVFSLKLADHFARHHGKCLYNSHEEGMKQTIRDRIINYDINASRLFVGDRIGFDDLIDNIRTKHYRMVIQDSVQYSQFTYDQLQTLNHEFKKRKMILVLISFGKTYKAPKCNTDIMHACDVKMFFDKGEVIVDSRYLEQTTTVRLFSPGKKKAVSEPSLFPE
jgi:predicted ATP-dependent serine protease